MVLIVHYLNTDNRKNNFLVLGEGTTHGINGNFGTPKKKFSSDCSKVGQSFTWVYIVTAIIIICLTEDKFASLKPIIKI